MSSNVQKRPFNWAVVVFDMLNPIPYGFFVGALIFDIVYTKSADVMWIKFSAWLITVGLVFAVVPRLINLVQVWFLRDRQSTTVEKVAFWLYLSGVIAEIFNAFVHSRDAYGVVPEGVWLSALTVVLLVIGNVLVTQQHSYNVNSGQT